jgi:dienelactone hydrolase
MTRRARRAAPIVAVTLALAAGAACSDRDSEPASASGTSTSAAATTSTTVAPAGPPYEITELTREYVDASRAAVDPSGAHSSPTRTIVTTVRVPVGSGPFPLVVFAHGNGGHPRKATQLLDAWARAGYVVAAPAFPLTNDDVDPTVIADVAEQPADVTVVIDRVLADAEAREGPLAGLVDDTRVGIAGHSLGGAAVYGAAANTCCRDTRVDAVIALSAIRLDFASGESVPSELPLLAIHGTIDAALPYDVGRAPYDAWAGPKWLLTLEGGSHSPPYEDVPSPHDTLVGELTTLFWDAELRDDEDAAARLSTYAPQPELARIEVAR